MVQTQFAGQRSVAPDPIGCRQRLGDKQGVKIFAQSGKAVIPAQTQVKGGRRFRGKIHGLIVLQQAQTRCPQGYQTILASRKFSQ
jgi:hypothetical protein